MTDYRSIKIKEQLTEIKSEIRELPSNVLYENILSTLHSIERKLVTMNNRIHTIEQRMRERDIRETNKNIRKYAIDKTIIIPFVPSHTYARTPTRIDSSQSHI